MSNQPANHASADDIALYVEETERPGPEPFEHAAIPSSAEKRETAYAETGVSVAGFHNWEGILPPVSAPIDVGVAVVSPLEVEFWQVLSWGKVVVHYAALHFLFSVFWAFVPNYGWKGVSALFSPVGIYGTIYFKRNLLFIYIAYLSTELLGYVIMMSLGLDSVWWVLLVMIVQGLAILYMVSFYRYVPTEGLESYRELYATLNQRVNHTRVVLV